MLVNKIGHYVVNIYRQCIIFVLLTYAFLFTFSYYTLAASDAENFYDYVREERRNEIAKTDHEEAPEVAELLKKRKNMLIIGRAASISLSVIWCCAMFFLKKSYLSPHSVGDEHVLDSSISEMKPLEISAIFNPNEFTKYDLIATLFDLVRRKILIILENSSENRIILNEAALQEKQEVLENYEDFLINWFIKKVGNGEYFSFKRLWKYLSSNSKASEFDIDYDVWSDEVYEFVAERNIVDNSVEKWKSIFSIVGAVYAFLGIILLYLTGSTAAILLFGITFLSNKLSPDVRRRSKKAEEDYQRLLIFKKWHEQLVLSDNDTENDEKWDRLFVQSIVLENTESVLVKYPKYRNIYREIEKELEKAIIYANSIIHSAID